MSSFKLSLTATQFQAALVKAKAQGVDLSPAGGTLPETRGVAMHYSVEQSGDAYDVTVFIDKKPFLVPESMIESEVKALLDLA